MTFIEDFERWWREVGQTIPPCDTLASADRGLIKQFAKTVSGDVRRDLADDSITEDETDTNIQLILNDENISSPEKIKMIQKIYEN